MPSPRMKAARSRFEEFLSGKALRMTAQRALILEVFLRKEGHPTAEELCGLVKRRDRAVGQATVYRALKLLAEAGIARAADFGDGMGRYEHAYGHNHHDHLICRHCGGSVEVFDPRIERLQEALARRHGFRTTGHRLDIFGVCADCRRAAKP